MCIARQHIWCSKLQAECGAIQLAREAGTARLRSGAEAPRSFNNVAGGTPADITLALPLAARTLAAVLPHDFGTWALAVQLTRNDVRPTYEQRARRHPADSCINPRAASGII